ncbi:MAG: ABC transporter ATP-binding protein [Phycisphaerae bacterium]|nr:ABC transporter ATP-binding protein [Phycisphaerae bacterium]
MSNSNESILTTSGIEKSFGKGSARNHVLHGIDLNVAKGEFVSIMGPSGCGKSTLLHILGLVTTPDTGNVSMDGEEISATDQRQRTLMRRGKIGFIFQRFNLLGELSGLENVLISLKVRGLASGGKKRVAELFNTMGISHVMKRKPGQMSIGEQQRVAVVRALAHQPAILLADEPTGNLDSENGTALLDTFTRINRENAQTIVMITHAPDAAAYAHRTLRMKDGRIDA